MKFIPFLSKSSEPTRPWHCGIGSPKTLSFRAPEDEDPNSIDDHCSSPEEDDYVEKIITGLRSSERLFFEPGQTSFGKIIKEEAEVVVTEEEEEEGCSFKESVAMPVESIDPFLDFRRSMEEMVAAHHDGGGLKVLDWEFLEDLLTCYLKINGRRNHGYIVGAFVDLLVSLSSSSPSSSSSSDQDDCFLSCNTTHHSFTSPLSFSSSTCSISPCLSSAQEAQEDSIDNSAQSV